MRKRILLIAVILIIGVVFSAGCPLVNAAVDKTKKVADEKAAEKQEEVKKDLEADGIDTDASLVNQGIQAAEVAVKEGGTWQTILMRWGSIVLNILLFAALAFIRKKYLGASITLSKAIDGSENEEIKKRIQVIGARYGNLKTVTQLYEKYIKKK